MPEGQPILCLMCDAKSTWLFPYAIELSSNEAGPGDVGDDAPHVGDDAPHGELAARLKALASKTPHWDHTPVISRCSGGKHHGVRAVGWGANNKTRKRAGRVALAVTMRIKAKDGILQDPSGDGAFGHFVAHIERLFISTESKHPSLRELTRMLPPPPPGAPRYASTQHYPSSEPRRRLEQEKQQDCVPHDGLHGRHATATAAYGGEGGGYLPLRPGDCVEVECNESAPGDEHCRFKNYFYGKRLSAPSTDAGSALSTGWFPCDLVHLD